MFSWLSIGGVKASAADRAASLALRPLEELGEAKEQVTFVAGGKQTKGALPVKTKHFDAAVYSSRGRGYAHYNEDGAELFVDKQGNIYGAVFDQAGGLGGDVRGAASELAALSIFQAFKKVAAGEYAKEQWEGGGNAEAGGVGEGLRRAIESAHEKLVQRGEGEVTTGVSLVTQGKYAYLVNSGDSAAIHLDAKGNLRTLTKQHEAEGPYGAGCLTHAIGLVPELTHADGYKWALNPGDWLLLCSDGLLDAGLGAEGIGTALQEAETAEEAINYLVKRVLRAMSLMKAKPDNLTILLVKKL